MLKSERVGSAAKSAVGVLKNMNLQDYDYDFMTNKPKISKGCK